jgi:hypothetical protein
MSIDKQKLQKLLWAEAASFRADCADWKRNTEALQDFLGEKTVEEVALDLLAENDALRAKLERPDPILIQSLDSAIADYEQLEKNATRYQWLREARSGYIEVVEWIGPHATGMTGEDLDALLDAAMDKGGRS